MADNQQPARRATSESLCGHCGKCFVLTRDNTFILKFISPLHARFSVVTTVCSCTGSTHLFSPVEEFVEALLAIGVHIKQEEFANEALREAYWQSQASAQLSESAERKIAFFRWLIENNIEELY